MHTPHKTGKKGERDAQNFLKKRGFEILDINFSSKFGEIDIIAKKEAIHFVEVKTRGSLLHGQPIESVTESKVNKMIATAEIYLQKKHFEKKAYQFDVIEVFYDSHIDPRIEYSENVTL